MGTARSVSSMSDDQFRALVIENLSAIKDTQGEHGKEIRSLSDAVARIDERVTSTVETVTFAKTCFAKLSIAILVLLAGWAGSTLMRSEVMRESFSSKAAYSRNLPTGR